MCMEHYAHTHTFVGMNACVRLKVKRGSLVVVYAETVRKHSDCENLSPEHSGFLVFLSHRGAKRLSRSRSAAAVKIGRTGKV